MTREPIQSGIFDLPRLVHGAFTIIQLFWTWLVRFAHVLWACRISVFSALTGFFVFTYVLQAQNLFADLSFSDFAYGALYWLGVFIAIFLFWAFPVHYGARSILDGREWLISARMRRRLPEVEVADLYKKLRSDYCPLITWTPRGLGVLPFFAVGFGLWFADRAMDGALTLPEAHHAHQQIIWLAVADLITAVLFIWFVIKRRDLIKDIVERFDGPHVVGGRKGKADAAIEFFISFSLVSTTLIFLFAYFRPDLLAGLAPRALLIPFLFGSLVLIFSWLVRLGYRTGLPLAGFVIVLAALATATNTHLNDLRTIAAGPIGVADRQIDIKAAVNRWKTANNNCTDACPPALIIAAEGGASRAAFMLATVAGDLIDQSKAAGDPADAKNPGRRIFAISGVSGGALGAAVVRAALADAAETQAHAPPCLAADRTWFGAAANPPRDFKNSWRACLQSLVSGDYLSPVFVGLGFRDIFAPREWFFGKKSWIEDRAALIEQAWERHYDSVTTSGHEGHGLACDENTDHGLCRRFGYISSTTAGSWLPLLLLNGTSVETGRRIIVSDLISTRDSILNGQHSPTALYSAAYDVFELLSSPAPLPQWTKCHTGDVNSDTGRLADAPDIRLSTAAALSARFPIISPAGVLRVATQPCYGDRIVDGGYFENSGLTTALDIAEALKHENVTPIILWVQNDPIMERPNAVTPRRPAATPQVGTIDEGLLTEAFGLLAQPIDTILSTREGHGAEAADLANRLVEKVNAATDPNEKGFFQIGVHAILVPDESVDTVREANCSQFVGRELAMTKVSMSWWLSAAVQSDLDAQMCDERNRSSVKDLLARLSQHAVN